MPGGCAITFAGFIYRQMDIIAIIDKYYSMEGQLRELLLTHSRCVARKALECARRCAPQADMQFLEEAAMLHDIGIIHCDAPGIYCAGSLPYICHGVQGSEMLEAEGLPRHALVCERHTGAGLSAEDIRRQHLPLPQRDMLPVSLEEKLVCYADKFYSKSGDPEAEKPLERVLASMERFGPDTLARFRELHALFGH